MTLTPDRLYLLRSGKVMRYLGPTGTGPMLAFDDPENEYDGAVPLGRSRRRTCCARCRRKETRR